MSDVILKAIAETLAESEAKFEKRLEELTQKLDDLPQSATPENIRVMLDEVKALHDSTRDELLAANQAAMSKTGFVEQELRRSIAEISAAAISRVESSEQSLVGQLNSLDQNIKTFHQAIEAAREEFQSINSDTLNLTASGLEALTDRVDFIERSAATSIEHLSNELREKIESVESTPGPQGPTGEAGRDGRDGLGILIDVWKEGIHREGKIVSHHLGQFFKARCDTTSAPGIDDTWERLGSAGFRHCGGFDAEKTYEVGDLYVKDFATFACLGDQHVLWAARGPAGPRGEKGASSSVPGPRGEDGAYVKQVHTSDDGFVMEMTNGDMHAVPFPPEVKELFASPGDFLPLARLKSIAATSTDFKSFQAAIAKL